MKNQTARFTCGTDATLTVSLRKGKSDWVVTIRQKTPGEKTLVGGKSYVDLADDAKAQQVFEARVHEAVAAGWVMADRAERAPAFTAIPPAPGARPAVVPRAAKR